MEYVVIGVLGFVGGYLFDLLSLRPIRGLRPGLFLLHLVLMVWSTIGLCFADPKLPIPFAVSVFGAVVLAIAVTLEVFSLFVNLPFARTYVGERPPDQLITTGMYALTRHPGLLWYFFMLVGFILISGSQIMLITAPLWMALDVLWVVIQEKFVFLKTLPGYAGYQRQTPFLIPTTNSIRACLSSLTSRQEEGASARIG